MEIQDKKTKHAFIKYMKQHPEQRFWQSIRNFAGVPFVYISNDLLHTKGVFDTFFLKEDYDKKTTK